MEKLFILNFIIVLLFNMWWAKDGLEECLDLYRWKESGYVSILYWCYAVWGIVNLIYGCLLIN